jgi:hypothetical protein
MLAHGRDEVRQGCPLRHPEVVVAVQVSWREADEMRLLRHER